MLNYLHLYTLKIIWTIDFVVISISLKYESINHFHLFLCLRTCKSVSFHPAYIIEKEIEQYIKFTFMCTFYPKIKSTARTQYTQNRFIELNFES